MVQVNSGHDQGRSLKPQKSVREPTSSPLWRTSASFRVEYKIEGRRNVSFMAAMSLTDMILRSAQGLNAGAQVEFALVLDGRPQPLDIHGTVVASDANAASGSIRVSFAGASNSALLELKRYVEQQILPKLEKAVDSPRPAGNKIVELAQLYGDLGRPDDALAVYRKGLAVQKRDLPLHEQIALLILRRLQSGETPDPALVEELSQVCAQGLGIGESGVLLEAKERCNQLLRDLNAVEENKKREEEETLLAQKVGARVNTVLAEHSAKVEADLRAQVQDELRRLQTERDQLSQELLQAEAKRQESTEQGNEALVRLQNAQTQLEQREIDLRNYQQVFSDAQEQAEKAEAQLREQHAQDVEQLQNQWQSQLTDLNFQIEKSREEYVRLSDELQGEQKKSEEEMQRLRGDEEKWRLEYQTLRTQLDEKTIAGARELAELRSLFETQAQEEKQLLSGQFAEQQRALQADLIAQLEAQKNEAAGRFKKMYDDNELQIQALREHYEQQGAAYSTVVQRESELALTLQTLDARERTLVARETAVEGHHGELQRQSEAVAAEQASFAARSEALSTHERELNERYRELEQNERNLEQKLRDLPRLEQLQNETNTTQTRVQALELELAKAQKHAEELNALLDVADNELNNERAAMENERQSLNAMRESLGADRQGVVQERQRLSEIEARFYEREQQLQIAQVNLQQNHQELLHGQEQLGLQQRELENQRRVLQEQSHGLGEANTLAAKVGELEAARVELQSKVDSQSERYRNELETAAIALTERSRDMADLEQKIEAEKQFFQQQLADARAIIEGQNANIAQLQSQASGEDGDLAGLKAQLTTDRFLLAQEKAGLAAERQSIEQMRQNLSQGAEQLEKDRSALELRVSGQSEQVQAQFKDLELQRDTLETRRREQEQAWEKFSAEKTLWEQRQREQAQHSAPVTDFAVTRVGVALPVFLGDAKQEHGLGAMEATKVGVELPSFQGHVKQEQGLGAMDATRVGVELPSFQGHVKQEQGLGAMDATRVGVELPSFQGHVKQEQGLGAMDATRVGVELPSFQGHVKTEHGLGAMEATKVGVELPSSADMAREMAAAESVGHEAWAPATVWDKPLAPLHPPPLEAAAQLLESPVHVAKTVVQHYDNDFALLHEPVALTEEVSGGDLEFHSRSRRGLWLVAGIAAALIVIAAFALLRSNSNDAAIADSVPQENPAPEAEATPPPENENKRVEVKPEIPPAKPKRVVDREEKKEEKAVKASEGKVKDNRAVEAKVNDSKPNSGKTTKAAPAVKPAPVKAATAPKAAPPPKKSRKAKASGADDLFDAAFK